MFAKVVTFINLKGGVAKTTTTVGTALALAKQGKRVLVIDLDPQTNATVMLIGEERWQELDEKGYTIATLFSDMVDERDDFDLHHTIQHDVGNIKDVKGVDLLPCSIRLVYLQDELYDVRNRAGMHRDPYKMLEYKAGAVRALYDYILIDCPPNLGILSLNGLMISQGYVIPATPDILSTYGMNQIINRIDKFSINRKLKLSLLGVVFTRVKGTVLHDLRQRELRSIYDVPFFDTVFPENIRYAEAAEYGDELTFRQKWGGGTTKGIEPFMTFGKELLEKLG